MCVGGEGFVRLVEVCVGREVYVCGWWRCMCVGGEGCNVPDDYFDYHEVFNKVVQIGSQFGLSLIKLCLPLSTVQRRREYTENYICGRGREGKEGGMKGEQEQGRGERKGRG